MSTAHSLLNALTASQFLVRQPASKRYSLGPELVRIGAAATNRQFVLTEHARECMGQLASAVDRQCVASIVMSGDIVIIAKAGLTGPQGLTLEVGSRMRYLPPFGTVFAAWDGGRGADEWLEGVIALCPHMRQRCLDALAVVRAHGYSIGMPINSEMSEQIWRTTEDVAGSENEESRHVVEQLLLNEYLVRELTEARTYQVGNISAPVFGPDGGVALALAIPYFNETLTSSRISRDAAVLVATALKISRNLRGDQVATPDGPCRYPGPGQNRSSTSSPT